jgi:hypothetical protein
VEFHKEVGLGAANDAQQYRALGIMCLIYGAFILLLVLIPNPWQGRLWMMFCSGALLGVGALLIWSYRRLQARGSIPANANPPQG